MAAPRQYLHIRVGGLDYLVTSAASFAIEQGEHLTRNDSPRGNVVAWRTFRGRRVPVYSLDENLRPVRPREFARAVFLEGAPGEAAGLVVEDVHLLPEAEAPVQPFAPLGPGPTPAGHLFSGAALNDKRVTLALEPRAFVPYLLSLGSE